MRISVIPVGRVEASILVSIGKSLSSAFPRTSYDILEERVPIPERAYNPSRRQYHSGAILLRILEVARAMKVDRALGVLDVDIYVPNMNFIFGEAQCPGRAALISLYRLRPEFYGLPPNVRLLEERAVKEAIHEVGHTLGLGHCRNSRCVMAFSLHIGMTDRKYPRFCEVCRSEVERRIR
jgi:archaemetzincin